MLGLKLEEKQFPNLANVLLSGWPKTYLKSIRAVKTWKVNLIYNKAVEKDSYLEDSLGHHYFAGTFAMASNTCQNWKFMCVGKQYAIQAHKKLKCKYLELVILGNWRDKMWFSSYFIKNRILVFQCQFKLVSNQYTLPLLFWENKSSPRTCLWKQNAWNMVLALHISASVASSHFSIWPICWEKKQNF